MNIWPISQILKHTELACYLMQCDWSTTLPPMQATIIAAHHNNSPHTHSALSKTWRLCDYTTITAFSSPLPNHEASFLFLQTHTRTHTEREWE